MHLHKLLFYFYSEVRCNTQNGMWIDTTETVRKATEYCLHAHTKEAEKI